MKVINHIFDNRYFPKGLTFQQGFTLMKLNVRRGFTLIEVILVTAIIGAIMAVAAYSIPAAQKRARDTQRLNDLDQYRSQIQIFADSKNNGIYPVRVTAVELTALCDPSVLSLSTSQCVDDPQAPGKRYWYQTNANGTSFVVWGELEDVDSITYFATCSNGLAGEVGTTTSDGSCPVADVPTNTPPPPLPPTSTPLPTATDTPLATPTNTPIPTNTPLPTNTPVPTSTPVPTATPIVSSDISYFPTEDSYVSSQYTSTNHGNDITLVSSDWGGNNRTVYMKFNISSATNISAAKLKLTAALDRKIEKWVYTTSTSWSEGSLIYSNKPALGAQVGHVNHLSTNLFIGEVVEITLDPTKLIKDASGFISLALDYPVNTFEFYSSESGNSPELVLTVF